ncbi:MAG: NAD(P)H-dependent oxidoreductase [Flavobacteriales bacterium]|nr:NAD(P)H-dependent oxidoreductase [Flavobacteriales bacterium]
MKKVLVFAGSNSRQSINKQLALYAASFLGKTPFTDVDLNDFELPVFSVDREKESGYPKKAKDFDALLESHDGYILSLAEHNGSYTAAFKNLFDWLSRIQVKVWRRKPMLLLSTSTGARGGANVMEAALTRFPRHDAQIISHLSVPSFNENFHNHVITDSQLQQTLVSAVLTFEQALLNPSGHSIGKNTQ